MYVVIAGAGMVGGTLAARLVDRGHDVVVVDASRERCEEIYSEVGAVSIHGNATNVGVLEEAGIERAQVAVGVMREDADNLAFTLIARSYEVPHRVVRMRDPRYEQAFRLAGATYVLSVVNLYMHHLMPALERPPLRHICELADGKADLVSVTLTEGSRWVRRPSTPEDLQKRLPEFAVLIGVVGTDGSLHARSEGVSLRPGDELIFIGRGGDLMSLAEYVLGKG